MVESQVAIKYEKAKHFIQFMQSEYSGGELLDCPDASGIPTRTAGLPYFLWGMTNICYYLISPQGFSEEQDYAQDSFY